MEQYSFKKEQKRHFKEFLGMDASPETDDTGNDVSSDMIIVYKKLLRNAKMNGVPATRAADLVNEVLNLYNTLVSTKYTFTIKTVLARSLKFFYNKVM